MVNDRVRRLLAQISELEEELQAALVEQQASLRYRIEGTRILFERNIREAQRRLKTGLFRWLGQSSPRNVATAPVIYAMIVPLAVMSSLGNVRTGSASRLTGVPSPKSHSNVRSRGSPSA